MNKREAQKISNQIIAVLREERIKKGISQYKLAKDIGMSKSSILYIENQTQHPTLYTALLIANYLNVDISEIIKEINFKNL
ncbi:MAG: helix-turn-helix transcriptional regulator [Alphaproteobacteria bacterium]|nr:helix-turn-helix transcriptional regulator [Alphaproteobacteria bacterium]